MRRRARGLAALSLLALATAGCRKNPSPSKSVSEKTGGTGSGSSAVPPKRRVRARETRTAQPAKVRALGRPRWLGVAAYPRSKRFAVVTPTSLRLYSWPARKLLWKRPAPRSARHAAFSPDGERIAVLGETASSDKLQIDVYEVDGGRRLERRIHAGLSAPRVSHGIQPPPAPTGLSPAPGGHDWWIKNPYGMWLAKKGAAKLTRVEGLPTTRLRADQTGRAYWGYTDNKPILRAFVGTKRIHEVRLPCRARWYAADLELDRLVAICSPLLSTPGRTLLLQLSTGKILARPDIGGWTTKIAILDRRRAVLLNRRFAQRSWIDGSRPPRREAQAGIWKHIEVSLSGKLAAAVGDHASEVVELASGRVLCDGGKLPELVGLGFAAGDELWALAYRLVPSGSPYSPVMRRRHRRLRPTWTRQLRFARITLPRCKTRWRGRVRWRGKVPVSVTTHVVARWLPKPRAFVFNACNAVAKDRIMGLLLSKGSALEPCHGQGDGAVYIATAHPTAVHKLARSFSTAPRNDEGTLFATIDPSRRGQLWAALPRPHSLRALAPSDRVAFCGPRVVAYGSRVGWEIQSATSKRVAGRLRSHVQPDLHDCRGDTLVVARGDLYRYDVARRKITAQLTVAGRIGALRLLPDGKHLLIDGGETGWRLVDLP